jgi:hypothetical protein
LAKIKQQESRGIAEEKGEGWKGEDWRKDVSPGVLGVAPPLELGLRFSFLRNDRGLTFLFTKTSGPSGQHKTSQPLRLSSRKRKKNEN